MKLRLRLFGAFRDYAPHVELTVAEGATAAEVKAALAACLAERFPAFRHQGLIAQSALGNARVVLRDDEVIEGNDELAVLPPVCGG